MVKLSEKLGLNVLSTCCRELHKNAKMDVIHFVLISEKVI